jgi:hypothetical protein
MTWIIGSSAFWAGAILISDIRLSFIDSSKKPEDCLQKIYPLSKQVMAGFSGSVIIGFEIIDQLREQMNNQTSEMPCNINILAHTRIPRIARRAYKEALIKYRPIYKKSEIILASAHPTLKLGATPFARTSIHIFRDPDFNPVKADRRDIVSIGSGTSMKPYLEALEQIKTDRSLVQTGANSAKMVANIIGTRIMKTIENMPKEDVSSYLQFGVARQNEASVSNLEFVIGGTLKMGLEIRNGARVPKIEHVKTNPATLRGVKLPTVIRSKKEFEEYCQGRRIVRASAKC